MRGRLVARASSDARLWFERRFRVDTRALAALRIALGTILLLDVLLRARHLAAFYTDAGVLPTSTLRAVVGTPALLSVHALSGSVWLQVCLFLAAGLAALDDDEHVTKSVETAQWAREYLHEHLDARTWESGGNFVLCEVGDASAVADACQHRGVIVRDCSSFGLPECIRVTCGTRPETERAVETINEVLTEVDEACASP